MKTLKVLVVMNNCQWSTLPGKIDTLKTWFARKVDFTFDIYHTDYEYIPFVPYAPQSVGHEGAVGNIQGIDPKWYDENVTILAGGYDIVLFVVNPSQWPIASTNVRGWRTDKDQGPVELHVMGYEHENVYYPGGKVESTFVDYARHELLHALYMITGKEDKVHYWRDTDPANPNYNAALDGIVFPVERTDEQRTLKMRILELSKIVLSLLFSLKEKREKEEMLFMDEETVPVKPDMITKWALAIQRHEGWW